MSSIVVLNRRIENIKPHPNADKLELAVIGGWQVVVGKGSMSEGQLVTYVPPDAIVPSHHAERWGVAKYLSNGRVRAVKLRGEPSYGFAVPAEGEEGRNSAEALGITKYQPPMKFSCGDSEAEHPAFTQYTDVENLRHYTDVLDRGEEVVVTEKIHGTNSRIAIIKDEFNDRRIAGSRTMQRVHAENSIYWFPWTIPEIAAIMEQLAARASVSAILFGEVYGKVQSLRYGLPQGLGYRAFDAMVDGKYLDVHEFISLVPLNLRVPVLYVGEYNPDHVVSLSKGRTMIPGADHIREGVVVRPHFERYDPKVGRVILKYVSDDYLCGDFDAASE